MEKFEVGQEVLVKAKIVEIRHNEQGISIVVLPAGSESYNWTVVSADAVIVEDKING